MGIYSAPVIAGVQTEAGVEALLEGGARDPHPVAGTHRPVRVYLIVEEEFQPVLPAQPEISSEYKLSK